MTNTLGKVPGPLKSDLTILVIEDNPTDRQLLRFLLESRLTPGSQIIEASDLSKGCYHLGASDVDCVILDLGLPDSVGQGTFTKLIEQYPTVPIIVMTATKDREMALAMIKAGAADYLLKDYTNEDDTFQRIIFAVAKSHGTMRVPPDDAPVFERLEKAQRGFEGARRRHANTDMNLYAAETTHANADVSKKVYAEVQKLSRVVAKQAAQQEFTHNTVVMLDKELLRGHSGFPPMKTQVELINLRLTNTENRLNGVADDVDEVEDTQRRDALKLTETKMTNRTKILIAVLALIGVVSTAAATYLGTVYKPDKPPAGAK